MKVGDLVQVLPAKAGYYVILGRAKMSDGYNGRTIYWELAPVCEANFSTGGPMDEKFIEVASEGR